MGHSLGLAATQTESHQGDAGLELAICVTLLYTSSITARITSYLQAKNQDDCELGVLVELGVERRCSPSVCKHATPAV